MTISSVLTRAEMIGNGAGTAIPVNFVFFGQTTTAELKVIEVVIATNAETVLTNGSDYTVSGGNGSTGTVTATVAPPSTVKWVVIRETKQLQNTDYIENDAFPAETHENALDRLTAINQEQQEKLNKAVQLPSGFTGVFNTDLPPDLIANKSLVIDSSGAGFAIGPSTEAIETAQGHAADAGTHATNAGTHATNAETSKNATAQHLIDVTNAAAAVEAAKLVVVAKEAVVAQHLLDVEDAEAAVAQHLLDAEAAKDDCEQYKIDTSNLKIAAEAATAAAVVAKDDAETAKAAAVVAKDDAETAKAAAAQHLIDAGVAKDSAEAAEANALQSAIDAATSASSSFPLGDHHREAPQLPSTRVNYTGAGGSILASYYSEMEDILPTERVGNLGTSTEDSSLLQSTPNATLPSVTDEYVASDSSTYQTITWNGGTFRRYYTGTMTLTNGELADVFDDDNDSWMRFYKSNGGDVQIHIECTVAPTTTSYYHSVKTYTSSVPHTLKLKYRPTLTGAETVLVTGTTPASVDIEYMTPSVLLVSELPAISVGSRITYDLNSASNSTIYVYDVAFKASTGTDTRRDKWLSLPDTFESTDIKVATSSVSTTDVNTFPGFNHSSQAQPSMKVNKADSDYLDDVATTFYNLGTSSYDSDERRLLMTLASNTDGKVRFRLPTYTAQYGRRILSVRIRINGDKIPVPKDHFELNTSADGYIWAAYSYVDIFDGLTYMIFYQYIQEGYQDYLELKFKKFPSGVEPNNQQSFDFTVMAFEFVDEARTDGFNLESVPTLPWEREQADIILKDDLGGKHFVRTSSGGLPSGIDSTKVWSLLNQKQGFNVQPAGKTHIELPPWKIIFNEIAGGGAGGSAGYASAWAADGGWSGLEHGSNWQIALAGQGNRGGLTNANSTSHRGNGRGGAGGIAGVFYSAAEYVGRAGGNGDLLEYSYVTTPGMVITAVVGTGGDGQTTLYGSYPSNGGDGSNGYIEVRYKP